MLELTKSELEIMEVLWEAGEPLAGRDIVKRSVNKSWKDSSIHILINSLLGKGAIEEVGFVRTGKGYGRTFGPTESGEKYYADYLASIASKTSVTTLFSALFKSEDLTKDTLRDLEDLIEKKKQEL
ncbi:MAG: BlaI/MecI/CopY family transcriptional regulator [Firmicutes bacterium]|jgi:BlaI family penicillinase repressor|nr:BlaI/MecI/CopY family transcriptional regulator [Bacillota bacterium]NBI62889.1 hypothetical protein [Clostridiales bacterium]